MLENSLHASVDVISRDIRFMSVNPGFVEFDGSFQVMLFHIPKLISGVDISSKSAEVVYGFDPKKPEESYRYVMDLWALDGDYCIFRWTIPFTFFAKKRWAFFQVRIRTTSGTTVESQWSTKLKKVYVTPGFTGGQEAYTQAQQDAIAALNSRVTALEASEGGSGSIQLQVDQTPTENSQNLVTSGGVWQAIDDIDGGGSSGKSAYEIAVDNGFIGTEEQWLDSLHGEDGKNYGLVVDDSTDGVLEFKSEEAPSINIDGTLSISGAAAESSIVGEKLQKSLHMVNLTKSSAPATMAELEAHSYSWCSPSWFSDAPATASSGWAITIPSKVSGTPAYATQLFIVPDEACFYVRRFASGSWGSWSKSVAPSDISNFVPSNGNISTTYGNSASADSITTPGFWYVPKGNAYSFTDFPVDEPMQMQVLANGTVLTQIVIGMQSGGVYIRYKVGTNNFGEWHTSADAKRDHDSVYYAFGDSVVKGQVGGVSGVTSTHNYPACVGRLIGMQVQNKAVGGQGLVTDWSAINTTIENLDMSDASLITVGWSYNDFTAYKSIIFGDITDTEPTSYIGYYYTIMKTLQEKAPQAQVMLVTGYGAPTGGSLARQFTQTREFRDPSDEDETVLKTTAEMYDALEEMCNLHGWPCVNQHHGCAFNEFNASTLIGDDIHPTDDGYMRYGNHLAARIAANYANLKTF